ncbi:cbb3-type cytochrome c oxidase subunit I [Phycisphaerales bacterium AB-hyl4]|uniref:Cbb3-type cytochrome c oxidase subunit I n=1 Tax=Natronomicrosphaera hydrolytica TaxID=3242702 RepID=A0ABV4U4A3_9BACT
MSSIPNNVPTDVYGREVKRQPGDHYLNHGKGIKSWLLTLDHKRIGIMYMIVVLTAFLLGGIFALLLRTELISPGLTLGPVLGLNEDETFDFYNHMFTLHGAVMVFLFIIPAVPAILGNFVLPLMLGAKDVAFPRLNLLSWYFYMAGLVFFVWVLLSGVLSSAGLIPDSWGFGLDTGWTFYTPYSTDTNTAVTAAVMGAFILGFSSILTGVNFIASIHMLRAPGLTWFRLPLFLWALYATSIIQILATPVLAITLLLLIAERLLQVGIFDPALGGDPVLYQHFFWFYSHPAVYIMILPAFGIISEVIAAFSRKHIFGYKFIAFSSVAIALLGFIVWGHHMFVSGQSPVANAIFSLLTFSVAVPSAIKVFNWVTTMYKGAIRLDTPMLYAIGFLGMFLIGGLTGLFLGSLGTDVHLHDTYFVVAHFHFVMVGSMMFAFLAGMYFWWPKIFGKMYCEWAGRLGAVVVFIGFIATFYIQFVAGSQGMPRRYATYPDMFWTHHFVSTLGAYLLGLGLFWVLGTWIHSLVKGKAAPANPWGHNSLEWHTVSPPPHENFAVTPRGSDPYHFDDWHYDKDLDTYVLDLKEEKPAPASDAPHTPTTTG